MNNHNIFLESVLTSHESAVTGLVWTRFDKKLQLVSCSLDCTVCVWEQQEAAWSVSSRLDQWLGNKNAYFDVLVDPNLQHLVALNYVGAVLIWRWNEGKFTLRESFNGHVN